MAKIAFSKLGIKKNADVKIIKWNDQEIEVKQYLPVEEKLDLVSKILNESVDENHYYNVARVEIFKVLEIIFAYTNISFTDKQKEDVFKLYDLVVSSGLWEALWNEEDEENSFIPSDEFYTIDYWVHNMIKNIYEYQNSAAGIMETITTDYSNLELDAKNIQETLTKGEGLELVKDVITKLG